MKRDDTLWKAILEDLFDDFLRFFYENADDLFDINRGFEFLDKELEDLFPQTETENIRYVDKLVKVWLKNGTEEWILIHIEVQNKGEKSFAERMFIYFYRIRDRYKRRITAWAIFTDKSKKEPRSEYREAYLGTKVLYSYNTYKIINQSEDALKADNNPFAVVILTVLLALKKSQTQEIELIDLKIDLVKDLLKRQIPKQKIRALMNFLKYYVRFNKENTLIFENKFDSFTGKTYPMGIEQFLLHRAEQQGEKRGEKRGEKIGDERRLIQVVCTARKSGASLEFIAQIVNLTVEEVQAILKKEGID